MNAQRAPYLLRRTADIPRTAFMAKHKLSLRLYEELVVLLQQSGVDVGDTDHSRITAREMNEVIAGHGRGQIKSSLRLHRI